MASRLYEVHNPVIKNNQKVTLRFRLVLINLDFPMSLWTQPTPAYSNLLGSASGSTHTGRWSWGEVGLGGERDVWSRVRSHEWGGAVGLGGCVKVIKTFHDIRVCEVPRADHWDHSMEPIFLFLVIVQGRSAAARGVVVVYSDCLHQWDNREHS